MKHYSIAKTNAQMFAEERQQTIRIAKANRLNKYVLLFEGEQPTKNYRVVESVTPDTNDGKAEQ